METRIETRTHEAGIERTGTAQGARRGDSEGTPASSRFERLQAMLWEVWNQVPAYRAKMEAAGIHPLDLRCLEDLRKMPFTTKKDLRDNYPTGLLARPVRELARFHASSGTTGKPTVVAYTKNDLDNWAILIERCLRLAGVTSEDVVQVAYGYGLFTGGMGLHYGAERLGATVIPASGGFTERQILLMEDLEATVLCCTPSYALHLAEALRKAGKSLPKLRVGIFGAEPWSEEMRSRIQQAGGIEAFDIYGLAEIVGPGVAAECPAHQGLHVLEDHFFPEIIDPASGRVLPDGEEGELVLTTLSKQAMPMLRYRTGDVTALLPGACPCGRTLRRMRRVSHRSDDLFIVRGVNVYPSQIESALLAVKGTLPHYHIVLSEKDGQERAEVQVEVTPEMFSDRIGVLEELQERLTRKVRQAVGVHLDVRLVEPRTLGRSEGKARRVVDRRPGGAAP